MGPQNSHWIEEEIGFLGKTNTHQKLGGGLFFFF